MSTLDRITIVSDDRRADTGEGKLKIGPDYPCIYIPTVAENALPNWETHGCSLVASCAGAVHYTGTIVGISEYDTARQSRTTIRCTPAESHDR